MKTIETSELTYLTVGAYHEALRPLKSRGCGPREAIRISVGCATRGRCDVPAVLLRKINLDTGEILEACDVFAKERFEPSAKNKLGRLGAYLSVWPTPDMVAMAIDTQMVRPPTYEEVFGDS